MSLQDESSNLNQNGAQQISLSQQVSVLEQQIQMLLLRYQQFKYFRVDVLEGLNVVSLKKIDSQCVKQNSILINVREQETDKKLQIQEKQISYLTEQLKELQRNMKTLVTGVYLNENGQEIKQEKYLFSLQEPKDVQNQPKESDQLQKTTEKNPQSARSLFNKVFSYLVPQNNSQEFQISSQNKKIDITSNQNQQESNQQSTKNDIQQNENNSKSIQQIEIKNDIQPIENQVELPPQSLQQDTWSHQGEIINYTSEEENEKDIQNDQQNNQENIFDKSSFNKSSSKLNQSLKQSQNQLSQLQKSIRSQTLEIKGKYYPEQHPNPERAGIVSRLINELYNQSWRQRHADRNFQYFIRDKQPLNELYKNYGVRQGQRKAELANICNSFRQVRGDGNCFYTAFGAQFISLLINNFTDAEFDEFLEKMEQIISFKIKLQKMKQFEINDKEVEQLLWQEFKYRLQFLRDIEEEDFRENELIENYAAFEEGSEIDQSIIDGCFYGLATIFLRNLAYHLIELSEQKNQVLDKENLLIWEEECNYNEVVIFELSKFLSVKINLVFFDNGSFTQRKYSEDLQRQIILLIRPGHYNAGYLENENIY